MGPISADFNEFAELHPEFQLPMTKRAEAELRHVFYDENGELLSQNDVVRNILIFAARMKALIPQMKGNPKWEREGAASEAAFKSSERTGHKSMTEVLSSPLFYMTYTRNDQEVQDGDFSTIIIDPQTISPKTLENLGLERFLPPKGTRKEKKVGHMAAAIPDIHSTIGHLQPFQLPHETPRKQRKGYRLWSNPAGRVLGIQRNRNGKIIYETDLHGAKRRIGHIEVNYDEEIRKLLHIQRTIGNVVRRVQTDWPQAKAQLPEIQKDMISCIKSLQFVHNHHKQHMLRIIRECLTFQAIFRYRGNTSVRYAPGSRLAKLVTLPGYAGKRIEDIESIRGFLQEDQTRIAECTSAHQGPAQDFYQLVENGYEDFYLLNPTRPMGEAKRSAIIEKLRDTRNACEPEDERAQGGPHIEPYGTYAHELAEHADTTIAWLTLGNREKAREAFVKMYLVAKLQHCYIELQNFYDEYLAPSKIPYFKGAIDELKRIRKELRQRRIAPDVETAEFHKVWRRNFGRLLTDLINEAYPGLGRDTDDDTRKKAKAKMRELFRAFEFEEIS